MKKTNVIKPETFVNSQSYTCDVVYVNVFSHLTVGELNSIVLCDSLVKYGCLNVRIKVSPPEIIESTLEHFVSYFQSKVSAVLVQYVGLNNATVTLVYSNSCCGIISLLTKYIRDNHVSLLF